MVKDRKTKLILAAVICASTVMTLAPNAMAADGGDIKIDKVGDYVGVSVNDNGAKPVNIYKDGGVAIGDLHFGQDGVIWVGKPSGTVFKVNSNGTIENANFNDITMNVKVPNKPSINSQWGSDYNSTTTEQRSFVDSGIAPGYNGGNKGNIVIGAGSSVNSASGDTLTQDEKRYLWAGKPGNTVVMGDVDVSFSDDFVKNYAGGQGQNASNVTAIGSNIGIKDSTGVTVLGSQRVGDYGTQSGTFDPYGINNSSFGVSIGSGGELINSKQTVAIGQNAGATNSVQGIAIGAGTKLSNSTNSIVMGTLANATNGQRNVVLGTLSKSEGANYSVALGANSSTGADNTVAIGQSSVANVKNGIAIGSAATVNRGDNGIAIGSGAIVNGGPDSIVLGTDAATGKKHALALGAGSQVNADDSVALGYNSVVNRDEVNVVSVGKSGQDGFTRRIINVSEGRLAEDSNDAVTGKQLYATNQNIGDLKYTSHNYIQDNDNLTTAASKLDEQVKENADSTASNKNEIDVLHNSGIIAGNIADGIKNAVVVGNSEVFGNGYGSVVVGNGGFVAGEDSVGLGNNVVIGNNANNSVALGSGSVVYDENTVSVGSDEIKRTISNVADGVNANDAVNKSQLDAVSTVAGQHTTVTTNDENIKVTPTTGENGQLNYDVALNKDIKVNTVNIADKLTVGDDKFVVNQDGSFSSKVDGTFDSQKFDFNKDGLTISSDTFGSSNGTTNIKGDTIITTDEYGNSTKIDGGSVQTENLTVQSDINNKLTFSGGDRGGLNINVYDTNVNVGKDGISLNVDNGEGLNNTVKIDQDQTTFSYSQNGVADATTIKGNEVTTGTVNGLNNTKWDAGKVVEDRAATEGQLQQAINSTQDAVIANEKHIQSGTYTVQDGKVTLTQVNGNEEATGKDVIIDDVASAKDLGVVENNTQHITHQNATYTDPAYTQVEKAKFYENGNVDLNDNFQIGADGTVTSNHLNVGTELGQVQYGNSQFVIATDGVSNSYEDSAVKNEVTVSKDGVKLSATDKDNYYAESSLTIDKNGATFANANGNTIIDGNSIFVGGSTGITINGTNKTITGLSNTKWVATQTVADRAATEGQLSDIDTKVNNVSDKVNNLSDKYDAGAVKYDTNNDGTINKDKVTLAGENGTTITNVADGIIGTDSKDAVNGGQLFDVKNDLQENINTVNDRVTAVDNKVGNLDNLNKDISKNNTVVGAINAVDDKVNNINDNIANITTDVDTVKQNTTGITYDKDANATVIGTKDNQQNLIVNGDVTANNVKADNVTTNTVNATDGTFHNSVVVGGTHGTQITDNDVVINKGTENEVSLSGVNTHVNDVDAKVGDTAKLNDEIKNNDSYKNDQSLVGAVNAESAIRSQQVSDLNSRVTSLGSRVDSLESRMDDVEDRIDKVGAMSAAIANLRTMGYDPQAPTEIAVGIGQYKSETGLALGIFHYPNQDFMLSLSVSTSGDEVMGGVGATWKLGRKTPAQIEENREAKKIEEAEALKKAAKEAEIKAQAERHAKLLAEREAKHEA